jgi:mono/diheme cytochrome c family protein
MAHRHTPALLLGVAALWVGVLATTAAGRQAPHIRHAPAQARMLASPLDLTAADVAAGREAYAANCARCHGAAGTGGLAPAEGRPAPSDLTRPDLRTHADGELY